MYRVRSYAWSVIRLVLLALLLPVVRTKSYASPEKVGGWQGWVEAPKIGVLAFIDTGGRYRTRW